MKLLIVARHGDDTYGNLNLVGEWKIRGLSETLKRRINGDKVKILSSTMPRATRSAEILAQAFGVEVETHEVLWSEGMHPEDLPAALELVRQHQDDTDVLILVTHYEYVWHFPGYYAQHELQASIRSHYIEKGDAWVLDCTAKTLTRLRPMH